MKTIDISLKKGSRVFLTGFSGSGKTTLALHLCEAMPPPLVIVDTKPSPAIRSWARGHKIRITSKPFDWSRLEQDIVFRPPPEMLAHPMSIDEWIGGAFRAKYIPSIYIDEGLQVGASSSRVGKGVTGLFSRGRERGMRVLFGTQRPAWISQYVMTEADAHLVGYLPRREDRKILYDITGKEELRDNPPEDYQFWYSRPGRQPATLLQPIDIKNGMGTNSRHSLKLERQIRDRREFREWLRDLFAA